MVNLLDETLGDWITPTAVDKNNSSELNRNKINVMTIDETNQYYYRLKENAKLEKFDKELKKFRNNKIPEGFYWNEKNEKFEKLTEIAIIDSEIENMNKDQKFNKSNFIAKNIDKNIAQQIKKNPEKSKDILQSQVQKLNPIEALKDYNKEMLKEYLMENTTKSLASSDREKENQNYRSDNLIANVKKEKTISRQFECDKMLKHQSHRSFNANKVKQDNSQNPRILANYFQDNNKSDSYSKNNSFFNKSSSILFRTDIHNNESIIPNCKGGVNLIINNNSPLEERKLITNVSAENEKDLHFDNLKHLNSSVRNSLSPINLSEDDSKSSNFKYIDELGKYFNKQYSMQIDIQKEFRNFTEGKPKKSIEDLIPNFFRYISNNINNIGNTVNNDKSNIYLGKKRKAVDSKTESIYINDSGTREVPIINLDDSITEKTIFSLNSPSK
jgi:hypothetical protein